MPIVYYLFAFEFSYSLNTSLFEHIEELDINALRKYDSYSFERETRLIAATSVISLKFKIFYLAEENGLIIRAYDQISKNYQDKFNLVDYFIKTQETSINTYGNRHTSPIYLAVQIGDVDIFKLLLDDVGTKTNKDNFLSEHQELLFYAANPKIPIWQRANRKIDFDYFFKNAEVIKILLSQKIDINFASDKYPTALFVAILSGFSTHHRLLLDDDLMTLFEVGNNVIKTLLEHEIDVMACNRQNQTVLDIIIQFLPQYDKIYQDQVLKKRFNLIVKWINERKKLIQGLIQNNYRLCVPLTKIISGYAYGDPVLFKEQFGKVDDSQGCIKSLCLVQ